MNDQNEEKNVIKSDEVIINENINVVNKKIGSGLRKATTLSLVWLIIVCFICGILILNSNNIPGISEPGDGGLGVLMLIFYFVFIIGQSIIYLIPACITWLATERGKTTISSNFCVIIYWFAMLPMLIIPIPIEMNRILFSTTIIIGILHIVSIKKYTDNLDDEETIYEMPNDIVE